MKRKSCLITGFVITVIVVLSLAACGGEKSEDASIISKNISVPDKKDEASSAASVEESVESSISEGVSKESAKESIDESQKESKKESIVESVPEPTKAPVEESKTTSSSAEPPKEETPTPAVEKEKPAETNEKKSTGSQAAEVAEQVVQEESIEEDFELPYNYVEDFSIEYQPDYAHIDTDSVILGNNEKLTIWLTAYPSGLNTDDFFFYCEEDELTYTVEDIKQNTASNETAIRLSVRSLKEGYHDFGILSTYDIITLGEESPGIWLTIHGLDSRDGQIVYVTPTGEKYHFSADCAGENATATTLYDVESYEYEPCGKCAG